MLDIIMAWSWKDELISQPRKKKMASRNRSFEDTAFTLNASNLNQLIHAVVSIAGASYE
jgi:hypothetical protein